MDSNLNNFPFPPPPSFSDHSYTIIIFFFSTFSCILLGLVVLAFCSYLLKKKKKSTIIVETKEVKHTDDHLKIKEAIVEGPHGKLETVVLSVEEDLHEKDDIVRTKKELEEVHHHNSHANNNPSEITPSALEAGHGHSQTFIYFFLTTKDQHLVQASTFCQAGLCAGAYQKLSLHFSAEPLEVGSAA
ncbi:hypothetical protein K7X08_002366 [Anisodus acutangulus]|uniref:Uncharacterized protein n=1 Tax=Anisodus acutangulus TaxID=402998 RepID=A0A9Q1R5W8_9SOLA|nr:hypothetical protein K7X08_002366 [Anisodus acutangulus]